MINKRIATLAVGVGIIAILVISQLHADSDKVLPPAGQIGRYQIVKIPNVITMVDTTTGETWELVSENKWVSHGSPVVSK